MQITDENANDVTVTAMILGIQPAMEACVQFKRKNFAASSLPVNFQSRFVFICPYRVEFRFICSNLCFFTPTDLP